MSSTLPDTVYLLFGPDRESDIGCFAWEGAGQPAAVRIIARSAEECRRAVTAISASPASFVVYDGWRYTHCGAIEPYDPARPASADELSLDFDVEYVSADGPGYKPHVYILTYDLQAWECAKRAVRHLLQLDRLSRQNYIELKMQGSLLGISADRLDTQPDRGAIVALHREMAIRQLNG